MGMNMNEFVTGLFKAEDIAPGACIRATIVKVESREFGDGEIKPVVYFKECKPVALNQTRLAALGFPFGWDSDGWIGKQVDISQGETQYAGRPVARIVFDPVVAPQAPRIEQPKSPVRNLADHRGGSIEINERTTRRFDDPPPPSSEAGDGPGEDGGEEDIAF
jgi:hypothetical protein